MDDLNTMSLKELAEINAKEVVSLGEDAGLERQREQLSEFQRTRQPNLNDKQYTALFRTYNDHFVVAVQNLMAAGTAVAKAPVLAESIADDDLIYRPHSKPMTPENWELHLREVEKLAKLHAHEIAELASSGGDARGRVLDQAREAAQIAIGNRLTRDELDKDGEFYKQVFLNALQGETEAAASRVAAITQEKLPFQTDAQCQELVEESWKKFLTFAAAGSGDLAKECLLRFEDRIQDVARDLRKHGKDTEFLARIEAERAKVFDEYTSNPAALKRRLCISENLSGLPQPQRVAHVNQHSQRSTAQDLGHLAVRTAVRATVWDSVRAIFRLFR